MRTQDTLLCHILDSAVRVNDNSNKTMQSTCLIRRRAKMCIEAEGSYFVQLLCVTQYETRTSTSLIFREFIPVLFRSKTMHYTYSHKQQHHQRVVIGFEYLLSIIRSKTCDSKIRSNHTNTMLPKEV
jgi:hypothetical protein